MDSNAIACYENVTGIAYNATDFDIYNQPFTLLDQNGQFVDSNTMYIDQLKSTLVTSAAIFGTQLGLATAIMIVILLMTSSERRRSLSFIFNVLALLCDVIRCILQCVQLNSAISDFAAIELWYFVGPGINAAIATSVAGSIFTFLLFVFIELALIIQVRVVCAASSSLQREAITWFTVCVGLLAVGFRMNLTIANIGSTLHLGNLSYASQDLVTKAQNMANISAIVSICVFSAIFCFKLFKAIKSRRAMGLKQFGPMQIIFIMGCQTLVVPAIFAILAYYALPGAQLGSMVETIVAVFLPLSSIWASANTNAKLNANNRIVALPPYQSAKKQNVIKTDNALFASTQDDSTLSAEEGRGMSKFDSKIDQSKSSIEGYRSASTTDIEMQHAAVRQTSFPRGT